MSRDWRAIQALKAQMERIESSSFSEPVWSDQELLLFARLLLIVVRRSDEKSATRTLPFYGAGKDYIDGDTLF